MKREAAENLDKQLVKKSCFSHKKPPFRTLNPKLSFYLQYPYLLVSQWKSVNWTQRAGSDLPDGLAGSFCMSDRTMFPTSD